MEKRKLVSGSGSIVISSDSERLLAILDGSDYLRHIVPNLEVGECQDEANVELKNGPSHFREEKDRLSVQSDYAQTSEGQICYLVYYCMQRELLRHGIYVAHGAALLHKGRATLLLGTSKIGKSTLSLEMALDRGCLMYGDDAVRLAFKEDLKIDGGNTHVGVRGLHKEHPRITQAYPTGVPKYVDTRRLGLHTTAASSVRDVIFLEPDILASNYTRRLPDGDGKIMFYEMISREMRSAGYCLINDALPLPPLDNGAMSHNFLRKLSRSSLNFHIVAGGLERMRKDLLTIIQGENEAKR